MKTEAQRGTGIDELIDEFMAHREFFLSSGTINNFLQERNRRHFMSILRDTLLKKALLFMAKSDYLDTVLSGMSSRQIDPYSAVEELVSKMMPDSAD